MAPRSDHHDTALTPVESAVRLVDGALAKLVGHPAGEIPQDVFLRALREGTELGGPSDGFVWRPGSRLEEEDSIVGGGPQARLIKAASCAVEDVPALVGEVKVGPCCGVEQQVEVTGRQLVGAVDRIYDEIRRQRGPRRSVLEVELQVARDSLGGLGELVEEVPAGWPGEQQRASSLQVLGDRLDQLSSAWNTYLSDPRDGDLGTAVRRLLDAMAEGKLVYGETVDALEEAGWSLERLAFQVRDVDVDDGPITAADILDLAASVVSEKERRRVQDVPQEASERLVRLAGRASELVSAWAGAGQEPECDSDVQPSLGDLAHQLGEVASAAGVVSDAAARRRRRYERSAGQGEQDVQQASEPGSGHAPQT